MRRFSMMAVLGAIGFSCAFAPAGVIYVDASAPANGNGATWGSAYQSVDTALAAAVAGDEIRVAGGFYSATGGITLKSGVAVRGGYRGLAGGGPPDDRDLAAFPTNLGGTPHVVRAVGVDGTAILDGFEIRNAHAEFNGLPPRLMEHDQGAGIYADNGSPTILSCLFANNFAYEDGAAIYGGAGLIEDCTFENNHARDFGGGVYSNQKWTIRNCVFRNNFANFGGAVSGANLVNCLFDGNRGDYGSAIYGATNVINCTIVNNERGPLGCVAFAGTMRNSILWNNANSQPPAATFYSCIENGSGGNGNISGPPQFRDPDGADNIPGNADDDYRLATGSPCIDAGDTSAVPTGVISDLRGDSRVADDRLTADTGIGGPPTVDMGAYEVNRCLGDLNGDFVVSIDDLAILLAHFGESGNPPYAHGNLAEDSSIELGDLALMLANFGVDCR